MSQTSRRIFIYKNTTQYALNFTEDLHYPSYFAAQSRTHAKTHTLCSSTLSFANHKFLNSGSPYISSASTYFKKCNHSFTFWDLWVSSLPNLSFTTLTGWRRNDPEQRSQLMVVKQGSHVATHTKYVSMSSISTRNLVFITIIIIINILSLDTRCNPCHFNKDT